MRAVESHVNKAIDQNRIVRDIAESLPRDSDLKGDILLALHHHRSDAGVQNLANSLASVVERRRHEIRSGDLFTQLTPAQMAENIVGHLLVSMMSIAKRQPERVAMISSIAEAAVEFAKIATKLEQIADAGKAVASRSIEARAQTRLLNALSLCTTYAATCGGAESAAGNVRHYYPRGNRTDPYTARKVTGSALARLLYSRAAGRTRLFEALSLAQAAYLENNLTQVAKLLVRAARSFLPDSGAARAS